MTFEEQITAQPNDPPSQATDGQAAKRMTHEVHLTRKAQMTLLIKGV